MENGSGHGLAGLLEIATRCGSGAALKNGICWSAEADTERSWSHWIRFYFQPLILPHLMEVQSLSSRQFVREILLRDREFSEVLSEEAQRKSVEAGRHLLLHKSIKADRTFYRIQQAVQAGTTPGHFPTLFAVRAAMFSIAPRTAVMAYLLQELICEIADPDYQAELLALGLSEVNDFFRRSVELEPETAPSNA
ncbi:MAG: hypothetical protein JO271_19160 [Verrucomicrobia bacterium]|nr:hypothetical protein [Verrucomicrobiota bacterium]MBV9276002.1 hypothetical protein [Verrucomicrobiota bacterium]